MIVDHALGHLGTHNLRTNPARHPPRNISPVQLQLLPLLPPAVLELVKHLEVFDLRLAETLVAMEEERQTVFHTDNLTYCAQHEGVIL